MHGPPRVAIIGSGAIAEQGHIPALTSLGLNPAIFVDVDASRAERLSSIHGGKAATRWEPFVDDFDAAIVAVPHSEHCSVGLGLLSAGKDVLMEKPLALNGAESDAMLAAARSSGARLVVGHMRRQMANNRFIKAMLDAGRFGRIHAVRMEEGTVDRWDAVTDGQINRSIAGGGVLIGVGVHGLDLLRWWFGPLHLIAYADDNKGGVEANCVLWADTAEGAPIRFEASRTRDLTNTVELLTERGRVRVSLHGSELSLPWALRLRQPGTWRSRPRGPSDFASLFEAQLRDFLEHVRGATRPTLATATEAADTVRLVEAAYRAPAVLTEPWASIKAGTA